MKSFLIIFLLIKVSYLCLAQCIAPKANTAQILASSGKFQSSNGYSLNFTVGEVMVQSRKNNNLQLNEGFHALPVLNSIPVDLNPSIRQDNFQICKGDVVQLEAIGGAFYQWSPSIGLNNATIANPIANPSQSTDYQVKIINNNCTTTFQVKILVAQLEADFDFNIIDECGDFPTIELTNKSKDIDSFKWIIGDDVFENQLIEKYKFKEEGDIEISLIGTNTNCVSEKTVILPIKKTFVPNVFTPNGDGFNDTFQIPNIQIGWKIIIFNRWGQRLYESEDYKNDWDGNEFSDTEFFYQLISPSGNICNGHLRKL
jgi:gliding motility-associated-like protein